MTNIKSLFDQLTSDLERLKKLLANTQPVQALVSRIPAVLKGQEQAVINEIIPELTTDMLAMKLAAEAFKDIHIKHPFSQKSARRYVGIIHLHPDHENTEKIVTQINAINTIKAKIEHAVVSENDSRQARFSAIHDNCPRVMTVHLYRKIHCVDEELVKSVRFSWQRKDSLHQPDKVKLLAQITIEQERATPDNQLALMQLYQKIATTPEHALRIRRPVKVQPAANIVKVTGLKTVTAPLPIIVVQKEPLEANEVADFVASQVRKQRSDKRKNTVLGTLTGHTIEKITAV
ncbi:DNA replication terminus site-binding protein [Moritella viscosa]|uniref:DNA replication terminus site-binding protein (Ter bindingprotein) n=1 Tax=Moritella viscosa TaxID=80854 RepID=A0A090IE88_9GAMM|nr:DNA replication terminus site-binding protein [Moritella viscosa]CED60361.1 DNA replication terminus site-binding protein [Moritella viscosa]SGY98011.1 Putative DNA replication terminus site-binding protein (Ter bindingprotein) [Moritella viscosa]SGZ04742.1 Putative DNA replication terminus site-binding protein (Ter bindingprotein) [Moritella viscosa]SGZ11720.1 Putative DNA replication terminus site-binding protein (Ter bindingprotein) [Moritella viscosa]SGZ11840.1 Putative DNA replication 